MQIVLREQVWIEWCVTHDECNYRSLFCEVNSSDIRRGAADLETYAVCTRFGMTKALQREQQQLVSQNSTGRKVNSYLQLYLVSLKNPFLSAVCSQNCF